MQIQTINVAEIQTALGALLKSWPTLMDMSALTIQHGEAPPNSETACPWIGVYCVGVEYPLRTIGMGSGMRYQRVKFWLVCKEADPNTGNECTVKLEALVQKAASAVLSDTSLGGTVDALDDLNVTYPQWGKESGVYLQTAVIQFTAVTTVKAGG